MSSPENELFGNVPTENPPQNGEGNHVPDPSTEVGRIILDEGGVASDFHSSNPTYGHYEIKDSQERLEKVMAGEMEGDEYDRSTHEDMERVREELAWMADIPEIDADIDRFFSGLQDVPLILKEPKEAGDTPKSWSRWLAEDASDKQLLNFLEWHNYAHDKRAVSPETAEKLETTKLEYMAGFDRLKSMGLLHEEAQVDKADVDKLSVALEDIFKSHMLGIHGFTNTEKTRVEAIESTGSNTFKHEFNHAVLGSFGEYQEATWMDEALTEHLEVVMENGDPDIVDPSARSEDAFYVPERTVLAGYLAYMQRHGGDDPLTLRDLTRYYSAVSDESRKAAREVIDRKNERVFGDRNAIGRIETYMGALMERVEDEAEFRAAAQELAANPLLAFEAAA